MVFLSARIQGEGIGNVAKNSGKNAFSGDERGGLNSPFSGVFYFIGWRVNCGKGVTSFAQHALLWEPWSPSGGCSAFKHRLPGTTKQKQLLGV
jgi:hypothetical protein